MTSSDLNLPTEQHPTGEASAELLARWLEEEGEALLAELRTAGMSLPELTALRPLMEDPEYFSGLRQAQQLQADRLRHPQQAQALQHAEERARSARSFPIPALMRWGALHRQLALTHLQKSFAHHPELPRLQELLEIVFNENHLAFAEVYEEQQREQQAGNRESYRNLLESAALAIVVFRPGEGRVLEVNRQMEVLAGRPESELVGVALADLVAPEGHQTVEQLVARAPQAAVVRLDHLRLVRSDGSELPVAFSCNWLAMGGESLALVLVHDLTPLQEMARQRELHTAELEQKVEERTAQLRASETRYRSLFLDRERRARHLSLINQVQRIALEMTNTEAFLQEVARTVGAHFARCDVALLLSQQACDHILHNPQNPDIVCVGNPSDLLVLGTSGLQELNQFPHQVHPQGQLLLEMLSSRQALTWGLPAGKEEPALAEFHPRAALVLVLPIAMGDQVVGALLLQSRDSSRLAAGDLDPLQSVVTTVAGFLQSARIDHELKDVSAFNETLINSMLHALLVVSSEGTIKVVNERLCQTLRVPRSALMQSHISKVFGELAMTRHALMEVVGDVTRRGTPRELPDVQIFAGDTTLVFDLRVFRVMYRGEAQAVFLLINITQRWRKTHQLQLMNEMWRSFTSYLDIEKVLRVVLTCVTAGSGLGFHRGFILLREEGTEQLQGALALGPSSQEEASQVWYELSQRNESLQEILQRALSSDAVEHSPLQQRISDLVIHLDNPALPQFAQVVRERRAMRVLLYELVDRLAVEHLPDYQEETDAAADLFTAAEVVLAPLVANDKVVGILVADNLYSGRALDPDDLQLLETLAQQAGLTIENALTYRALQKAQKDLVTAERMRMVGEMAARISHEIRNPLTTIGGFARDTLQMAHDPATVASNLKIIVDEVKRLEELLEEFLDHTSRRPLDLQPHSINEIVNHSLLLADAEIKACTVQVVKEFDPDLPQVMVDRNRLLQALLNPIRNAAQAMPNGGKMVLKTTMIYNKGKQPQWIQVIISDSGVGIPERALQQIFDPFFSTKIRGSGLGLAIMRRIIEDHGGQIDVTSQEGVGTSFLISLPVPGKELKDGNQSDSDHRR